MRARAKGVERREGWQLAAVSVALGLGQLVAIAWMDRHLERQARLPLEVVVFLAYFALVIFLLWRMQLKIRAARPACPACGVVFSSASEEVAAATGRCHGCGAQVVSGPPGTVELEKPH